MADGLDATLIDVQYVFVTLATSLKRNSFGYIRGLSIFCFDSQYCVIMDFAQPEQMPAKELSLRERLTLQLAVLASLIVLRTVALVIFYSFPGLPSSIWYFEWVFWPAILALIIALMVESFRHAILRLDTANSTIIIPLPWFD